MRVKVGFSTLEGSVRIPSSKSCVQRALVMALLSKGRSVLHGVSGCDDAQVVMGLASALGAEIKEDREKGLIEVYSEGQLRVSGTRLFCKESGFALRVFSLLSSLLSSPMEILAEGSLLGRRMDPLSTIFATWGVSYHHQGHCAPLLVQGPLVKAASLDMLGEWGSQYVTGVLLTYLAMGAKGVTVSWQSPMSKPYVMLTCWMLERFGISLSHENYEVFHFEGKDSFRACSDIFLPGDWSSAGCLLVAGAISGSLMLYNVETYSPQADRVILSLLESAGIPVVKRQDLDSMALTLSVNKVGVIQSFRCDLSQSPDTFIAATALACFARGTSYITGVHRLSGKESSRGESIVSMLGAVGIDSGIEGDVLRVVGVKDLEGGVELKTYGDHRMVMLGALLGLRSRIPLVLEGAEAVGKSYPAFFEHLQQLQASVEILAAP